MAERGGMSATCIVAVVATVLAASLTPTVAQATSGSSAPEMSTLAVQAYDQAIRGGGATVGESLGQAAAHLGHVVLVWLAGARGPQTVRRTKTLRLITRIVSLHNE